MKRIKISRLVFLICFFVFCYINIFCFAAEGNYLEEALNLEKQSNSTSYAQPISIFPLILKVFSSLIFVVFLMLIFAYLVKKFVPYSSYKRKDGLVRVIDVTYLGPKKMIYVIEAAGEILIVGSDAASMSLLTKIEDVEMKKNILANVKPAAVNNYFSGILGKFMKEEDIQSTLPNKNIEKINSQINKLKGMKSDS